MYARCQAKGVTVSLRKATHMFNLCRNMQKCKEERKLKEKPKGGGSRFAKG